MKLESLIAKAPESARHFRRAAAASRAWSTAYVRQCSRHNIPEYSHHVSGIGQYAFPARVREGLSRLANRVREENEAGFAARPCRLRQTTLLALAREIVRTEGGGYYGFRN